MINYRGSKRGDRVHFNPFGQPEISRFLYGCLPWEDSETPNHGEGGARGAPLFPQKITEKTATKFFGSEMTPHPHSEVFRKFIEFGTDSHPLLKSSQ